MEMRAKTGLMPPRAKERQGPPETDGGREGPSCRDSEGRWPSRHLNPTLRFQTRERMHLGCFKLPLPPPVCGTWLRGPQEACTVQVRGRGAVLALWAGLPVAQPRARCQRVRKVHGGRGNAGTLKERVTERFRHRDKRGRGGGRENGASAPAALQRGSKPDRKFELGK